MGELGELQTAGPSGAAPGPRYTLRRAWPVEPGHLLLEYADERGQVAGAQWFSDPTAAQDSLQQTSDNHATARTLVIPISSGAVVLYLHGADPRLRALARILADKRATLVSHRPTKRAVLHVRGAYLKIVRDSRHAAAVAAAQLAPTLAHGGFIVPSLLRSETKRGCGILEFSEIPGHPLRLNLGSTTSSLLVKIGRALRTLHEARPATPIPHHGGQDEARNLSQWIDRLGYFDPEFASKLRAASQRVLEALGAAPDYSATLHKDFHDKQLIVAAGGAVGLVDMDTLASGDPALDLGNFIAHLDLHALQAPDLDASAAAHAFLEGYAPPAEVRARLPLYTDATRIRLAALYSFRPIPRRVTEGLLQLAAASA
jgi:aminoglycoside phosphotransferase